MPSLGYFKFFILWSRAFSALLFSFATSSTGKAEPSTDDLGVLGSDPTEQSSLTDWLWEEPDVNVLDIGSPDMLSSEAPTYLDFAEAIGPDLLGYSPFTIDPPPAIEVPSVQTDLDFSSLYQESAPAAECSFGGVDTLDKRSDCSIDLSQVRGRDPGLCPKVMNNIPAVTCCCPNAEEYDSETYPDFFPCFLCKYKGVYLDF